MSTKPTDIQHGVMVLRAEEAGRTVGRNAASWLVPESPEDALEILRMARDEIDRNGRPRMLEERYRSPSLSGEYSDDPTAPDVLKDAGFNRYAYSDEAEADVAETEILDAWDDAVAGAFYGAIETQARDYLSEWLNAS